METFCVKCRKSLFLPSSTKINTAPDASFVVLRDSIMGGSGVSSRCLVDSELAGILKSANADRMAQHRLYEYRYFVVLYLFEQFLTIVFSDGSREVEQVCVDVKKTVM
jgi:hypothetical protein